MQPLRLEQETGALDRRAGPGGRISLLDRRPAGAEAGAGIEAGAGALREITGGAAARPAPYHSRRVQAGVKRALDIAAALALLALTIPICLAVAVAIKLDSPGPILFNRTRVGKDGHEFVMYKFRTMVRDAEARLTALQHLNDGGAHMIRIKDDPRVTRLGRFLRSSSLDELPQLLNVLKGEMSLVGPRPQAPNEVALYTPEQRRRLAMPPGITGWWQVTDRHLAAFGPMVARDLEYIERWSLRLDAAIAARTVGLILGEIGEQVARRRPGPKGAQAR